VFGCSNAIRVHPGGTEGSKVKNGRLLDELREAFRDYEKGKR